MSLKMEGRIFPTELIVVSPLTSQAILGIDFLQAQQATIDLGHRMLHLRESGCDIPLINPELTPTLEQTVRMASTVEVPPRCRMEVTAWVGAEVKGIWLVEEAAFQWPLHVLLSNHSHPQYLYVSFTCRVNLLPSMPEVSLPL